MFKETRKEIEWAGRKLILETGKIARQATGSVLVTYGKNVILCTAVANKEARSDVDFFPLTVVYQEKAFAAGKIPGGYFKREGRPTEKETLTSRLIDRPIRPLFPDGFYNETQVICTVLAHDAEFDTAVPAMVGASAALAISGIPFETPIGASHVGYVDGEYVLNPSFEQIESSDLDLVVAGTDSSVMMVESQANCLPEDVMLGAVNFGHEQMQPVIALIKELADDAGKPRWEFSVADNSALAKQVAELAEKDLRSAYAIQEKQERSTKLSEIRQSVLDKLVTEEVTDKTVGGLLKSLEKDIVRGDVLKTKKRIDGRDLSTVRPIVSEIDLLPTTHGSALFTRGETQALVVATLGTTVDEQRLDTLQGDKTEHFMLHYNFPPFSVGEANMLRGPGRREIGHGKLAWRALHAVLPSKENFPYTIRLVSEITESNGSSSMATVCGSSLAMMDAGVPLSNAVSGIAMGLIKEGDDYVVLSDILGDEDHLGDMDFKVAGTKDGVTALQMDIKISGINAEIMQIALDQAKEGRLHILDEMKSAIGQSREDVNANAPKITTIEIPKDKIREVIGTGGKVIREICEVSGATLDIEDDGTVKVAAVNTESANKAIQMVKDIIAEIEPDTIYDGKVVRIVDFGAFVALPVGGTEGLVHISEIANERIKNVTDVLQEGQEIKVKVIGIDRGKVRLSMRVVNQETGEDISDQVARPQKPQSDAPEKKRGGNKNSSSAPKESRNADSKKKRRYY